MLVQLANILLRQAEKTQNARAYLDDLITQLYDLLNRQQFGQIIAVTVNGKTTQLQAAKDGSGMQQQLAAAELALSCLERGLTRVPRQTYPLFR